MKHEDLIVDTLTARACQHPAWRTVASHERGAAAGAIGSAGLTSQGHGTDDFRHRHAQECGILEPNINDLAHPKGDLTFGQIRALSTAWTFCLVPHANIRQLFCEVTVGIPKLGGNTVPGARGDV